MTHTVTGFPLSPTQKRIWLRQPAGEATPYVARGALSIEGVLDNSLLKESLQRIVEQNQILRTTFKHLPGMRLPLQSIADAKVAWQPDCDLSELTPAAQTDRLEAALRSLSDIDRDYERGPLVAAKIVTLAAEKRLLLISMPALGGDATTLAQLPRLISETYAGLQGGDARVDADREPVQYATLCRCYDEFVQ